MFNTDRFAGLPQTDTSSERRYTYAPASAAVLLQLSEALDELMHTSPYGRRYYAGPEYAVHRYQGRLACGSPETTVAVQAEHNRGYHQSGYNETYVLRLMYEGCGLALMRGYRLRLGNARTPSLRLLDTMDRNLAYLQYESERPARPDVQRLRRSMATQYDAQCLEADIRVIQQLHADGSAAQGYAWERQYRTPGS